MSIIQVGLLVGLTLGWLPALIALGRHHHQTGLIVLLTILGWVPLLGWVTWILALVMAAATDPKREPLPPLRPLR
jgi:hypothetical protein